MSKEKFERGSFKYLDRRQGLTPPTIGPSTTTTTTSTGTTSTSSQSTSTTTPGTSTGTSTSGAGTTLTSASGTSNKSSASLSTSSPTSSTTSSTTTSIGAPIPQSTSTKFVTASATSNTLGGSTTFNSLGPTSSAIHNVAPTGFFHDKGAVVGTFTAVGIVVAILVALFATTCIRRRRAKQFDADVAAAAAAAYRDADGYWEREDNWNNNGAPVSSGYTSSAYTDGTHGAFNEPAMSVAQGDYQNYPEAITTNNNGGGYPGNNGAGYSATAGNNGGGYSPANYNNNGGYPGGGGYAVGGEAYGMNNLAPNGHHDPSYAAGVVPGGIIAGAAGVGAGAYNAHHNRQKSLPPVQPGDLYQGYTDMGMNDSLDGGRYPVPPVRSRSLNQGPQPGPAVGRSPSNSSSGHGHVGYPYPYPQNGGSPPSVNRTGSKGPVQGYSQNYGAPLPQMQEHHNEGDAYDGLSPDTDHNGQHEDDDAFGEVEEMPRVLRVANE